MRAASRYAKALLSLAIDEKETKAVNKDMKLIAEVIQENENLANVLQSPVVRSSDKKAVLSKIFKKQHKITSNLVDTLMTNKRIALIGHVASKYNEFFDAMKDEQVAKVTTATPLDKDLEKKVLKKVKELTGKKATIENIIDEAIIGGFILRINDLQYDASVANQLNTLKREFTLN